MRLPNAYSMLVVIATALPSASTTEIWLVPADISAGTSLQASAPCGIPGCAAPIERAPISAARAREVFGREQAGERLRHKRGIRDVAVAVGVGKPPGLAEQMHSVDRIRRSQRKARSLEDAQHLQHGDTARTRRRHAAHAPAPVCAAQRLALDCAVCGEVALGKVARPTVRCHRLHDVARDLALVERARAAERDAPQRSGERRVLQQAAHRPGTARRVEVDVLGIKHLAQRTIPLEQRMQAFRHREALGSVQDCRLEQFAPGQLAMPAMRKLECRQNSGDPDRAAVRHRIEMREGLSAAIEEAIGARSRWRALAAVVGVQALVFRRPHQQEGPAADARGLRLHQVKNHLRGDRGIER